MLTSQQSRHGIVLIIVLVVIALLALSAYTFSDLMFTEHAGAQAHGDINQSIALTESAAAQVQAFLMLPPETRAQMGGTYNNPSLFSNQTVTNSSTSADQLSGYFAVIAPDVDTYGASRGMRFGLENESAKINLNGILRFEQREDDQAATGQGGNNQGGNNQGGSNQGGNNQGGSNQGGNNQGGNNQGGNNQGGNNQGGNNQGGNNQGGNNQGGNNQGGNNQGSNQGGASPGATAEPNVQLEPVSAQDALMALPGMTIEIADAILDWIDEDDEPRETGAERDYYSSLPTPYQPKNGPLNSLDELLLVRGVTSSLLYGRDANRNGLLDAGETQAVFPVAVDESLGSMDLGWANYLTVHSREVFKDPAGNPKIDLNGEDLQTLYTDLSAVIDADWAMFICAYRQRGPYQDPEGTATGDRKAGEAIAGRQIDLTQAGRTNLESVLDLVGARVEVTFEEGEDPVVIASPFADDPSSLVQSLNQLLDYTTVETEEVIPGRINVNLAPSAVLKAVPGMTDDVVNAILGQRSTTTDVVDDTKRYPIWLYTDGIVTSLDVMRQMMPFLTTGGDVFRAQVFGYFDESGATSRAEVIIDGTRLQVPVVLWTDMSVLGRGFNPADFGGTIGNGR